VRRGARGIGRDRGQSGCADFACWKPAVAPLTAETHAPALDFAERYKLSITDAMIAAAASLAGCARLWSQDMQDGIRIGETLRVADLFR
jgi:predicted nucleic acid-binding protein